MKKALIFGVSGQDGAYLAKLLLISKGYTVYGTSRDAQVSAFRNLEYLGIHQQIKLESAALNDFRCVLQVLKKTQPDEVYNLAGQTSVGLSFEQPVETLRMYCGGDVKYIGERSGSRSVSAKRRRCQREASASAERLLLTQTLRYRQRMIIKVATGESYKCGFVY